MTHIVNEVEDLRDDVAMLDYDVERLKDRVSALTDQLGDNVLDIDKRLRRIEKTIEALFSKDVGVGFHGAGVVESGVRAARDVWSA